MTSIKTWEKQPRSGQWVRTIWQWCDGLQLSSHNSGLVTLRTDPETERQRERLSTELSSLSDCSRQKTRWILPSTRVFVVLLAAVNTGHGDQTRKPDRVRNESEQHAGWSVRNFSYDGDCIPASLCVLSDYTTQLILNFVFIWRFLFSRSCSLQPRATTCPERYSNISPK